MKEFKNSALIRKELISHAYYEQYFNYLLKIYPDSAQCFAQLKDRLVGYYSQGNPILLKAGAISDKSWYVCEGMVIAYYYDHNKVFSVYAIFEAGEIAQQPDSFMTGMPSDVFLMACPDTHLLELSATDIEEIYKIYPGTERISKMVLAYQWRKLQNRDRLMRFEGEDRVKQFYKIFPSVKLTDKKKMMQKIISSYLIIKGPTLSRLRKKLIEEEAELLEQSEINN